MKYAALILAIGLSGTTLAYGQAASDPLAPTAGVKSAAEIDREWQQSVAKYDAERKRLLAIEEKQENDGPYRADWATLSKYEQPQWYKDAKFGIFIHWGVYAVPAAENEWYPRNVYQPREGAYKNFREHFATNADGKVDASKGYKDLIPKFRAERFDPAAWAKLFKESGARYVVPVAEHHDGFSMYDSSLSDWTVVKMGPKRDTLGDLEKAIRAEGLHFGLSSHRAEHNFFFDGGRSIRSDVNDPQYASLYGPAHAWMSPGGDEHELANDWTYVSEAWTRDWLARTTELVEKYHPDLIYFDWWIGQPNFRHAVAQFAAFYYNDAAAHGTTGVIDFKDYSLNWHAGVRDFERGQQDHILPEHWQTDTSISNASWGYVEHDTFKSPEFLVHQLIDIVSKNGNLLLNFGPRADGTIPDEVRATLLDIGAWLKVNGEALYGTTPWRTFGEGPTKVAAGAFHDTDTKPYTAEDFRFTAKGSTIYAIGMGCPADGKAVMHSLGWAHEAAGQPIAKVELLGSTEPVRWTQSAEALEVILPAQAACKYAYALRLTTAAK